MRMTLLCTLCITFFEFESTLIQMACSSFSVLFSIIGSQSISFKYLGAFYETGIRRGAQAKYVQKRCLQRLNFLKSIAGVWWGAHSRCMFLLYNGLIGSVLDYASVCYSGMTNTHMFCLERVQYRGIRLALGLMCSTPNNSLGSSVAYHLCRKDLST
jgi:hypothetical protein